MALVCCAIRELAMAYKNVVTCAAVITSDKNTSDRVAFTSPAATMHKERYKLSNQMVLTAIQRFINFM